MSTARNLISRPSPFRSLNLPVKCPVKMYRTTARSSTTNTFAVPSTHSFFHFTQKSFGARQEKGALRLQVPLSTVRGSFFDQRCYFLRPGGVDRVAGA